VAVITIEKLFPVLLDSRLGKGRKEAQCAKEEYCKYTRHKIEIDLVKAEMIEFVCVLWRQLPTV